jgi:hypothetical protein
MKNYTSLADMPAKERRALLDQIAEQRSREMVVNLINNMLLSSKFEPHQAAARINKTESEFYEMMSATPSEMTLRDMSDIAYAFGFTLDFKVTKPDPIDLPEMKNILKKEDMT